MRTRGATVRDRLLLLATALVLFVVMLSYFFVADRLGLTDDGQFLLLQTIGWIVFVSSVRRMSPWRRRKLRLRWPLFLTAVGLLLAHFATVGTFVVVYRPRWRLAEWYVITMVELVVFGSLLSWMD